MVFAFVDGPEGAVVRGPSVALAGQQVTLKCSSSSEPPSQYSWYFDGSLVANTSHYVVTNLTTDMSGIYTCMAFNDVTGHNTTAHTMLTVYGNYSCSLFLLQDYCLDNIILLLIPDGKSQMGVFHFSTI